MVPVKESSQADEEPAEHSINGLKVQNELIKS